MDPFAHDDEFLPGGVRLPDADAVVGGEVELVGGFDVEGGVPAVDVADGRGSVHAGGVRVGEDLRAEGVVADLGAPVLEVGEEELRSKCKCNGKSK